MASDVLEFYKEELSSSGGCSSAQRVEFVHRVHLVAHAIGPKRTVNQLLPFLKELQNTEDDELLYALAEEYTNLVEYIGGESNIPHLLDPLEMLARQEETVVREQAVTSICKIVRGVSLANRNGVVQNNLMPLLHRLIKGEWFTCRVSACGLLPTAYEFSDELQQSELRKMFNDLCEDETPMVRRAAASKFAEIIKVTDNKQLMLTSFMHTYRTLWHEVTQDSIRVSVVSVTLEICKKLSLKENLEQTLDVLTTAPTDKSWRVRQTFANLFPQFVKCLGREITQDYLVENFNGLLNDTEAEVRCAALQSIGDALPYLTEHEICTYFVPTVCNLANDSSPTVRGALSSAVGLMTTYIHNEESQNCMMNLIVSELANDEHYTVRLNIVKHAGEICKAIKKESLHQSILDVIHSLTNDAQWRVRYAVVNQVPHLATHLDGGLFESKLEGIILSGLNDPVFAVREASIDNIQVLARAFGPKWTSEKLLVNIIERFNKTTGNTAFSSSSSFSSLHSLSPSTNEHNQPTTYITKITILHAIPKLAAVLSPEQVTEHIVPLLLKAFKDSVPNVRFVGAKTAAALIKQQLLQAQLVQTQIKPAMEELLDDRDSDVQYFAQQALISCT